jgi:mono/diheme cytochrome c family protein
MRAALFPLLFAGLLTAVSESPANGQSSVKEDKPKYQNAEVYRELSKAPEKARNRLNPFENDHEAVPAGRLLFEDHCRECHGENAQGGRKAPSLRAPEVQNATPGTLFWLLTNGVVRKGMPAWSRLPEPQRWQIVRYLKSLGVTDSQEENPKPAS